MADKNTLMDLAGCGKAFLWKVSSVYFVFLKRGLCPPELPEAAWRDLPAPLRQPRV